MPIYEYECKSCGHVTEVLESMTAAAAHTCAKCGSQRMEKLPSAFGCRTGSAASGGSCAPTRRSYS